MTEPNKSKYELNSDQNLEVTAVEYSEKERSRLGRGIYLLPNLFTTVALFAGFYAIVASMKGLFDVAAIAIFVAMIADTLDGRIARLTGTTSSFGAQYDSLSDMVSFGIAPALVTYSLALNILGKVGWVVAFSYVAATSLRLARFNVQSSSCESDKRYFKGLPCTAAAGFVAGLVWVDQRFHIPGGHALSLFIAVMVFFAAACMVSNILYPSFKEIDLKGKVPFFMIILVLLILIAIALDPPVVSFSAFFIYAFLGPIMALQRINRRKKIKKKAA
jgi:CDP-diacylglycerol--serine O-phosphatidyltransferase